MIPIHLIILSAQILMEMPVMTAHLEHMIPIMMALTLIVMVPVITVMMMMIMMVPLMM